MFGKFNFKLYTRPTCNVNNNFEFKKGDSAPGYPTKNIKNPLQGYRRENNCNVKIQNKNIYRDNWSKSCARNDVCYNPVIRHIQNRDGKPDLENYKYTTRNYLHSRHKTYEQGINGFDYLTIARSSWPTHFYFTNTATGAFAFLSDYLGTYEAEWDKWVRTSHVTGRNYLPLYKNTSTGKYISFNDADIKNLLFFDDFSQVVSFDSGTSTVFVAKITTDHIATSYEVNNVKDLFSISGGTAAIAPGAWNTAGVKPEINSIEYNRKNQPPGLTDEIFYLENPNGQPLGPLTFWSGSGDAKNHKYIAWRCTCDNIRNSKPCLVTYKPLNASYGVNTAVSGRSRIARLKFNAKARVKSTKSPPYDSTPIYPKNSCEFCKRNFKQSYSRADSAGKSRINSRLRPKPGKSKLMKLGGIYSKKCPC